MKKSRNDPFKHNLDSPRAHGVAAAAGLENLAISFIRLSQMPLIENTVQKYETVGPVLLPRCLSQASGFSQPGPVTH